MNALHMILEATYSLEIVMASWTFELKLRLGTIAIFLGRVLGSGDIVPDGIFTMNHEMTWHCCLTIF